MIVTARSVGCPVVPFAGSFRCYVAS